MTDTTDLIQRLSDEADLCRNDGATDIAGLLDDTIAALEQQAAPSVAPEPVALNSGVWTVARSALSSMAHMDHEALTSIQWPTMASPSKERLQFARRVEAAVRAALTVLIAQSLESNPPRAPLTPLTVPMPPQNKCCRDEAVWQDGWVAGWEAAHGSGGK